MRAFLLVVLVVMMRPVLPAELPEYRVKAAFLYNFAQYTEWPATVAETLRLCTYGSDPFGSDLDAVSERPVGDRKLKVRRRVTLDGLADCNVLYVSRESIAALSTLLGRLHGAPVLIVADSPGATRAGAMINMAVSDNRVTFEANQRAARAAGLELRSSLLRLATEVIQ